MVHRLPPILRRPGLAPRPGCSKAPRGLFVLSRGTRIFTGTSISPSPRSRQCSSRYAFRAGRNLPDKEFRYLRTVIVTAAVHRCFSWELRTPRPLTFRHWAGISPYTSACAVAETCVFGKQSLEPIFCGPLTPSGTNPPTLPRHPLSRSYGVNLPSSLTEDRSSTLGRLPLPTSVGVRYGLQEQINHLEAFLDGLGTTRLPSPHRRLPTLFRVYTDRICLVRLRQGPTRPVQLARPALPTVSPHRSLLAGAGLSTCCPSLTLGTSLSLGPD